MNGLIIDDDPLVVQAVEHFVEKSELVGRCEHAGDVATAINLLGSRGFDFVLLDLHLPDLPGESVLPSVPPGTAVIVASSDPGFGAASYGFPNIVDYLVKPIDYVGFSRAVGRAGEFLDGGGAGAEPASAGQPGRVIFAKSGSEVVRVVLDKVRFVKAEANYVSFHFTGGARPVMALASMKRVAEQLPAQFLRVHRSYIVNREHVERFDGQSVHLGETSIPVGDAYRAEFLRRLGIVA